MQNLTPAGQNIVNDIAARYCLSYDAVVHMLVAVNNGGCSMAQFSCPELGGSGQWMRGGMIMVGDMFNHGLKATVDNLCNELANALANNQMFPVIPAGTPGSNHWWPADLGAPFSSGAQNNIRYAVFPNRLAVETNGTVVVYDTLNHNIGSVSQQQGGDTSLSFSSQFGTISVSSLPIVSGQAPAPAPNNNFAAPKQPYTEPSFNNTPDAFQPAQNAAPAHAGSSHDIIQLLEQLGKLRDAGVLNEDEFNSKKRELMARL